jgi:C4-dicarboxylate-specific signal transduction histidine kinase
MSSPATPKSMTTLLARLAETENQAAKLQREVEHCQRLATIGTIAAGVTHEVNNLLTPALAHAHRLKAGIGDPQARDAAIDRIVAGIESAAQIMQAVLGFASAAPNEDERAEISAALGDSLTCLARDPKKDGIDIKSTVPPRLWVGIQHLALQQVLLNLLLNACKAIRGSGSGRGEIAIAALQRSDGTTVITVADSGPGFPKDIAGRLFQPFTSAPQPVATRSATRASKSAGEHEHPSHGLGLSICKQIIESAGGTLAASSSNRGATFTITLPTASTRQADAI